MHTKPFFLRRSFAGHPMERPLHTTRILAGFLLIIITASISSPGAASPTQDLPTKTDGEALLLFKKSIGKDPNGVLKGWKPSTDHCRWFGVSCSSDRVAKLDLPRAGLSAGDSRADSIAALSALDMLTFLDLSDNELLINTSSLLRLSSALKQLDLAGAGVSGAVPGGLLSKFPGVAYVDLSHNNLSGLLPNDVLLGADELQILDLSYNNLSGDVSGLYTANSCKSLLHFDVSVNSFVGSIPSSLSNCQRLKNLNLAYNDFAGAIPTSFTSFDGLQQLDLSNNHLSGEIPGDIGDSCGSLVQLRLSDNNISGGIPLSFSSCSSLVVLDLANNNISGDFPDSVLG